MNYKKLILAFVLFLNINVSNAQTSFAPLVEELMPLVVNISTDVINKKDSPETLDNLVFEEQNRETLGSGFIIDNNGYIATNLHVIENASKISVITSKGQLYDADLIGQDSKTDIALIKINADEELSFVVFGDSDKVKIGDWVLAIGNTFGLGSSVSAGIISAKARDIGDNPYNDYLQTDAAINQGNSGGPLFNIEGEVIGVNTAMFSNSGVGNGVGFALPSNEVKWILKELKEKGKVQRSWLGVELKKATTKNGLSGFVITSIEDIKLAKSNNLEIGDMILEYDSEKVDSLKNFLHKISKTEPNSQVILTLWKNSKIVKLPVKVDIIPNIHVNSNNHKKTNQKGKYYAMLGAYIDDFKVSHLDKDSKLANKGVSVGDKIIKVNNKEIVDQENFEFLIYDAVNNNMNIKFDLFDENNNIFFVEINFDKKG